jgi:tetratricopeptide (TPR) repeat protein
LPGQISAQGRFGSDSVNCVKYLNFYRDSYKQGNMKEAAPLWRKAFKICPPTASQNMFIEGQKILKYCIENYKGDAAGRDRLIDTLFQLNDTRAQYYPKNAYRAHENKVMDMINYYGKDPQRAKQIYDESMNVIKEGGVNAFSSLIVNTMIKAGDLYKTKALTDEQVMSTYSTLNDVLEQKIDAAPGDTVLKNDQIALQNAFVSSGVATCDNLIKVFTPRFNENKEDTMLVKIIVKLLSDNECTDSELFINAVSQLYKLSPSANSAYYLYILYNKKGNEEKASYYLKEAANNETGKKKGDYMFELANYYYKNHAYSAAISTSRAAAGYNPALAGKADMIEGNVWAATGCAGDEMNQRAKFWVATDYMIRAKQKDPSLTSEADRNISRYRQYFPKTADAFMFDLTDGKSFTVSCGGMTATTTVRTNK